MARQSLRNYWAITGVLTLWSFYISVRFLLVHDWQIQPTDLGWLTRLGEQWMDIRPGTAFVGLHPNVAGGLIAMLLPVQVAAAVYALRRRKNEVAGLFLGSILFSAFTLLMTSSRAAWLALGCAGVLWVIWHTSRLLERRLGIRRASLFAGLIAVVGLMGLVVFLAAPGRMLILLDQLPGPSSARSRLELFQGSIDLIGDYPLIGGGLTSFPALYSEYILLIPHFYVGYAHNLFLDVILEQGVFGLLALTAVLLGAFIQISHRIWSSTTISLRMKTLRWSAFSSLLILFIHGFFDDPLYGMEGTPLLLVIPGLIIASAPARPSKSKKSSAQKSFAPQRESSRTGGLIVGALLISMVGSTFFLRRPLIAVWDANLGAIKMGQSTLADWPTGVWDEGGHTAELAAPSELFENALSANPYQRTALFRLGVLAMLERDYDEALVYLSKMNQVDPGHRGGQKSLGYTYVWLGDFDNAELLLAPLPEVAQELEVYTWWWENQGRPDLAERAASMAAVLNGE